MAKKSRKAAVKYSELSQAGKKKHRRSLQSTTAFSPRPQETDEPAQIVNPTTQTISRTQSEVRRASSAYQYVGTDLKMIGILTAAIAIILIVLSFVIG